MIRILAVDDHEIMRQGIVQLLQGTPDLRVTGEAGTGEDALKQVAAGGYDLMLLDISLPDRNGLEILQELRRLKSLIPVLVLSMYPENQYAKRALRAGASGYVVKTNAFGELVVAIRRALQGKRYISSSLAEELACDFVSDGTGRPHERLSDREYQVLCRVASGKNVCDIASELDLNAKTVTTYKARILQKLDLNGTADMIRYAFEQGLVS